MTLSWDIFSSKANMLHLMEFLKISLVEKNSKYLVYKYGTKHLCVVNINNSYTFFSPLDPNFKGGCIDLLLLFVSTLETENKLSDWEKVQITIDKYVDEIGGENFLDQQSVSINLELVSSDFNLFTYKYLETDYLETHSFLSKKDDIELMESQNILENPLFKGKVIMHKDSLLYPLVNQNNHLVGLLADTNNQIRPLPFSDQKHSIWYSNIGKKTDAIFVFNSPKEAISFYLNFKIDNAVYISCPNINYGITELLFNIQKASKAKKLILSFTGNNKGYTQDLLLFSQMKDMSLILETKERFVDLSFSYQDEEKLSQFYSVLQKYNNELNKQYTSFDALINQPRIKQYSINIVKDSNSKNSIKVRLPLSLNSLKLFVWSYHKYFVRSKHAGQTEILKPQKNTWYQQFLSNKTMDVNNQETKMYKLAM